MDVGANAHIGPLAGMITEPNGTMCLNHPLQGVIARVKPVAIRYLWVLDDGVLRIPTATMQPRNDSAGRLANRLETLAVYLVKRR